jgi:hypothetical protein
MPKRVLVVADPPQNGRVDVGRVATQLGLTAAEAEQKLAYPLPEAWSIAANSAEAAVQADALSRAGARVITLRSGALAQVPAAETAERFQVEPQGISWATQEGAKAAFAWASMRSLRQLKASDADLYPSELVEIAGIGHGGPMRVRLLRESVELDWPALMQVLAEQSGLPIDGVADAVSLRPTLIGGIPLTRHFEAAPAPIRARMSDPFEFAGALVCAQRGVLAARPL